MGEYGIPNVKLFPLSSFHHNDFSIINFSFLAQAFEFANLLHLQEDWTIDKFKEVMINFATGDKSIYLLK